MSRIKYDFFDGEAEVKAFTPASDGTLELQFPDGTEGFLSIDGVVVQINRARAIFDLRYISDGEFAPCLIMKHGRIILPKIKKCARLVGLCEPDADYIRGISLRERRLAERVKALELEIEKLKDCIFGTKIL